MASHAFITSWLLSPGGNAGKGLGIEWEVGFRGQEYENVMKYEQVMEAEYTYTGGNVGIRPSSSDPKWDEAFSGSDTLAFCGYYWWRGRWFGGFLDHWPINEGSRSSRDLKNSDGQFDTAWRIGVRRFCFVITDRSSRRTNFGYIYR